MRFDVAFGSVLIFRLVTFWLIMLVGWTIYGVLHRARRHGAIPPSCPAARWRQQRGRASSQQSGLSSTRLGDLQRPEPGIGFGALHYRCDIGACT
jgi:hypothetical protein